MGTFMYRPACLIIHTGGLSTSSPRTALRSRGSEDVSTFAPASLISETQNPRTVLNLPFPNWQMLEIKNHSMLISTRRLNAEKDREGMNFRHDTDKQTDITIEF